VAHEVLRARTDYLLSERRGLGQEEEGKVVERRLRRHALELVRGRDHVEDGEARHDAGMIERHAVGDATTPVVADDCKTRSRPSRAMSSTSSEAISRLL
jgi:hypothetical protein